MNLTRLKQNNKGVGSALMQVALLATSFSASAATAAYYSGRRNTFSTNGSKSYLVDPTIPGVSKDLFKYTKINPTEKKGTKSIKANDLIISTTPVKELLVIDQNIKNYQQFTRLIKPGVGLVEIPKGVDGFAFLLDKLSGYQNLSAIHLFSHANAGELLLGNTNVDSKSLKNNVRFAKVVNQSMKQGGDFLLYGCELGKGEKGDEFLQVIKNNSHVDVAASNNLTGNTQFKGDWNLEISKGDIETKPLADSIAMKDFTEVLQNVIFDVSTWGIVTAGTYNSSDANINAEVSRGGFILKADGESKSTRSFHPTQGGGLAFGQRETKLTLSLTGGQVFKPFEIKMSSYGINYFESSDQRLRIKISTNLGGSVYADFDATEQKVIGLSSLPAGASSIIITPVNFPTNTYTLAGNIAGLTLHNITTPVLPVRLVDFSVKANQNNVALQWQTATESNNKKFVIYRSDDEKAFKELASIDGAGNSSALKNYTFLDKEPLQGNNYYKLVQVDNDGKETELGLKNVAFDLKSQITIYPNPTSDKATITFEAAKYHSLSLSSLDGKILQKQTLILEQFEATVDLAAYPTGVYIVKLVGVKESSTYKLLKK